MTEVCTGSGILEENRKLIYYICSKYTNFADKEDLYQAGALGLMKAKKNYDNTKDVKFSTYAYDYILGEVSKYARENKSVKVSRDMIKLGSKINEYIEKFKQKKGFEPSTSFIAQMLEISEDKVIKAIEASLSVKSLDASINQEGKEITLLDITPSEKKVTDDQMIDLKEAFKGLTLEEKKLVIERYYNNLTQSEVASIMGVNQVYVSRMEKKALEKMKLKMVA